MAKICWTAIFRGLIGVGLVAAPTMASTQTRPIQFSKMVLDPDAAPITQRVKVGTICLLSGTPLNFGTHERTLNTERYERIFNQTLSDLHFAVVAKSADMFEGEGRGPQPEFLIGGKIRPASVNICDSVNGQKGSISISVEWQVFDRNKRDVVETIVTEGTGQLPKFNRDRLNVMLDTAFKESLTALVDKGVLQKYLGVPET